jgi:hypothetical protein
MAFALVDADDHPLTIDIGGLQMYAFGDAESGSVTRGENGPIPSAAYRAEKVQYLFRAWDHRQFLRLLRCGDDILERPVLLERDLIEKS